MARVRGLLTLCALLGAAALLSSGCGDTAKKADAAPAPVSKPHCAGRAGWQKLANRIHAPVYCPGWLPDPLSGRIGAVDNNINSVSRDRSYLESWVWQDTDGPNISGELHVNLRAYPGRTTIPTCRTGGADSVNVPCFAQPEGWVTAAGIRARLYTVNQDADSWHLALLWRRYGNLYTLSEHRAPPLTYEHVLRYLKHELGSLVLIKPAR
jgi:hypothetical protein